MINLQIEDIKNIINENPKINIVINLEKIGENDEKY